MKSTAAEHYSADLGVAHSEQWQRSLPANFRQDFVTGVVIFSQIDTPITSGSSPFVDEERGLQRSMSSVVVA